MGWKITSLLGPTETVGEVVQFLSCCLAGTVKKIVILVGHPFIHSHSYG